MSEPEEFRGIYLTLDYQMLNERAKPYIRKRKTNRRKVSNRHVDHAQLRAKNWAREYINELMDRNIKVRKLVFDAGLVDRSNFYRFLNDSESTNISLPLLYKIIRHIEDVVGLEQREYDPDN